MTPIASVIRRHPVAAFFVLAYLLSWWGWAFYLFNDEFPPIASFGPFLAALLVLGVTHGRRGIGTLFRRIVRWRVKPIWYVVAFGLPIAVTLAATGLNLTLGAATPTQEDLGSWPDVFATFLIFLLIPGLGGTWEEPGWRGYALPRMQQDMSALRASLIIGVLWAFWHLPLMVVGQIEWSDIVLVIEVSIVSTWIFNGTLGSVLMLMLLHSTNNAISGNFFSPMFEGDDSVRQSWLLALIWGAVAVAVLALTGAENLSRRGKVSDLVEDRSAKPEPTLAAEAPGRPSEVRPAGSDLVPPRQRQAPRAPDRPRRSR